MVMIKDDESGQVQISDDVIAIIANTAALEVEGVVTTHSGIAEILGKIFLRALRLKLMTHKFHSLLIYPLNLGIKYLT